MGDMNASQSWEALRDGGVPGLWVFLGLAAGFGIAAALAYMRRSKARRPERKALERELTAITDGTTAPGSEVKALERIRKNRRLWMRLRTRARARAKARDEMHQQELRSHKKRR